MIIAPSILAANFAHLALDIEMINNSAAQYIHIDVMDGVFVPNISFGVPIIEAIRPLSPKFFDVHLMIQQPNRYIKNFATAGTNLLTVHYEACTHLHSTIYAIKNAGMQAGVALNPHTPVWVLSEIIACVDLVCIMSVNPGFGGQTFIENTYKKIKDTAQLIEKQNSSALIEIDGGVSPLNAKALAEAGANVLVAGSAIFKSENPLKTIEALHYIYK